MCKELTHDTKTIEAREKYWLLVALAKKAGAAQADMIPFLRHDADVRAINIAAEVGVENLLRSRPDLRREVKAIYPGLVKD